MKIGHFNHSDKFGGAARYATRIVESQLALNINSQLYVNVKKSNKRFVNVIGATGNKKIDAIINRIPQTLDKGLSSLEKEEMRNFKSPNIFGSTNSKMISSLGLDLIHLHWINGGFLSIKQIGKINLPIVWSILDMWPLSGAEHYTIESDEQRIIEDYSKSSRISGSTGLDISRLSWNLKKKYFKNYTAVFTGPWMLQKNARGSLFDYFKSTIIPPPIDTKVFRSMEQSEIRRRIGLPLNNKIIGYFGGTSPRKGWNLIEQIINSDFLSSNSIIMVLVGNDFKIQHHKNPNLRIFRVTENDDELIRLYNLLDLIVAPSKQEAFGLVAQEAQSCGVPALVPANSGLQDVVTNGETGVVINEYLSKAYSRKILEILASESKLQKLSSGAREKALKEWDTLVVASKFMNLYEEILLNNGRFT
jgi:glycosyltransferase involved in cell wall biosynthesis